MNHKKTKRIHEKKMDELRRKLNWEIEMNNFNLTAPSVMQLSVELDRFIVEYYRDIRHMPIAQ
jgi:hypothetical protein